MSRPRPTRPLALALLALAGCMAPVLPPVHPMSALPPAQEGVELAGVVGYAPSPGAGLGDAVVPGSPYVEGEFRYAFTRALQLQTAAGITFHRYLVPWPSSLALGLKVVPLELEDVSVAVAPRVTFASSFNLLPTGANTVFGTREGQLELPVLAGHRFGNGMALSAQGWARGLLLRQEDLAVSSGTGKQVAPTETGRALGLGLAGIFSFPRLRGSSVEYHLFLGGEELWLWQTGASNTGGAPLVSLSRFSLTGGFGITLPQ